MNNDVRSVSAMFPCYNDALTIEGLVDQVYAALTPLVPAVEVIVVNDGSSDGSHELLDAMVIERPWLHGFRRPSRTENDCASKSRQHH